MTEEEIRARREAQDGASEGMVAQAQKALEEARDQGDESKVAVFAELLEQLGDKQ
jgi:hypothetical protein